MDKNNQLRFRKFRQQRRKMREQQRRKMRQQTNQSSIEGSSLQGNDEAASVQIEMETLQSSNQY